jgi:hypothetical protein
VTPDQKIIKKKNFGKSVLFDQKKPEDRPGTGEKNRKKFEKFSTLRMAGPDRTGTGPAPAWPGLLSPCKGLVWITD